MRLLEALVTTSTADRHRVPNRVVKLVGLSVSSLQGIEKIPTAALTPPQDAAQVESVDQIAGIHRFGANSWIAAACLHAGQFTQ
jgi:chemotaxis signal transduction protein